MSLLHHRRVTSPEASAPTRWMLVLHGIYGAGRNWASVARRFVDARPEWGAVLVDLRQHGESQGFSPPHDLASCAADLHELVRAEDIDAPAILGHSFGGKVALVYARNPARPLLRVWVADSTPEARPPLGSAWSMLRVLRLHAGPFPNRAAGMAAVEDEGFPPSVSRWMSTNLVRQGDEYVWRLDADVMESLLRSFFATDAWDVIESPPSDTHIHLLRADRSGILTPDACKRIETLAAASGRIHLHHVSSGHWINADNPAALQELLVRHMP